MFSHAQPHAGSPRIEKIMKIVNSQDSLSRALFLDTKNLANLELTYASNTKNVWSAEEDSVLRIVQFYDIRLEFKSNRSALKFHKKYLLENSENGPEIKTHGIQMEGIDELKVYTQDPNVARIFLEPYGIQALCFLFVVKNYFVKIYTTCTREYHPTFFKTHLEAVRDRINKYSEK